MASLKKKLYVIIFEAETPQGKLFDVVLIGTILMSLLTTLLESVESIEAQFGPLLYRTEIVITLLFSLEYILRLYCSPKRRNYAFSFFGLVDLVSILPFFVEVFFPGARGLTVVRGLRMLRVFRVFKLTQYSNAGGQLWVALKRSQPKILVFLSAVIAIVFIVGALMYVVEGRDNGFTSIPKSIYWAIVTITTVGYGDIVPRTVLGQLISSILMVVGYGVIAVPTGIISTEIAKADFNHQLTKTCPSCFKEGHAADAQFCSACGAPLP